MELIDTKEKFLQWGPNLATTITAIKGSIYHTNLCTNKPWWAEREALRISNGLYRSTDVTTRINKYFPVYAHVSQTDPTQVAFTPDAACGEKDKQIKTTIGRLIQKLIPIASQEFIQSWVDEHNSEVNMEILFASKQEITDIYINSPRSGGCMSSGKFDNAYHPTLAYHTDNIRLAYVKAGDTITHRTLVYENGDDKRFIRCYPAGDTGFKRKLVEMGYKVGNWVGAELNLVKFPDQGSTYTKIVMPYLDANNGHADSYYSTVAIIDGKLKVINTDQRDILDSTQYRTAATTDGYCNIVETTSSRFTNTCAVSGKAYNQLIEPVDLVSVFIDGEVLTAIRTKIPPDWVIRPRISTGQMVFTDPKNVVRISDGHFGNSYIVVTKEELAKSDYVAMGTADESFYIKKYYTVQVNGKHVLKNLTQCIYSYKEGVQTSFYIMSSDFNKRSYYKTNGGYYITKDSEYLVTTSGKKVVPGLDNFYKLENGSVVLRKPLSYYFYNKAFYFATREELELWKTTEPKKIVKTYFDNLEKDVDTYVKDIENFIPKYRAALYFADLTFEEILRSSETTYYARGLVREVITEKLAELDQQQPQTI